MTLQITILTLGISALYLVTVRKAMRITGYILGSLTSLLILYSSYSHGQFGMFCLTLMLFTYLLRQIQKKVHIHWYTRYYRKSGEQIFSLRSCRCGKNHLYNAYKNKWYEIDQYPFMSSWEREKFESSTPHMEAISKK